MKVVKFKAGFGNQLFQYAFSKYLGKIFPNEQIKIDYTWIQEWYRKRSKDYIFVSNIDNLNVCLCKATDKDLNKILKIKNHYHPRTKLYKFLLASEILFNRKYLFEKNRLPIDVKKLKKYDYFDGYWQSYKYLVPIEEELRKEFTPKIELSERANMFKNEIDKDNSAFIGVRLGDYVDNKKHWGNFTNEYFNQAIKLLNSLETDVTFYVFSNDIEFVKENYNFNCKCIFVDLEITDFEEFILMSSCKHAIITNSTFHWWAAWLINNKNKIVVAPKKWFSDGKPIDIIPDEWVKI